MSPASGIVHSRECPEEDLAAMRKMLEAHLAAATYCRWAVTASEGSYGQAVVPGVVPDGPGPVPKFNP